MDRDDNASPDAMSIVSMLSISTLSSTATAPNLPGPGRNLGLLFDRLGGGLERFVRKRAGNSTRANSASNGGASGLQLVRLASHESVDTNATAPNLPGAGRTVGNALSILGKGLERFMTRRAVQLGLGPEVVARDIRALYAAHIATLGPGGFFTWSPPEHSAEVIRKLTKKLLKYSKAQLLSTQLTALNEITNLSIENNFLREILGSQQLSKYLSPRYTEPELHWASAKAFLSIQEKEVHSVWTHFYHYAGGDPPPPEERVTFHLLQERIRRFLWDANLSFIMARHIQNRLSYFVVPRATNPTLDLWRYHLEVAASHPEIVEWELIDNHFASNQTELVWASKSIFKIAYHMPKFRAQYSSRLAHEQIMHAKNDSELDAFEDSTNDIQFLYNFLEALCDSEDLAVQLTHLRSYPDTTRMFLKEIVFGNEIFIAYIHAMFHSTKPLAEMSMSLGFPSTIVTKGEFPACGVFLHYFVSGTPEDKVLAEAVMSSVARRNRYCKSSLTTLINSQSESFKAASCSSWMYNRVPCFGEEITLRRSQFSELTNYHDKVAMKLEDIFHYSTESTIWLEVHGDISPFHVAGHYPVLAGYTSDHSPNELYVAMVYLPWKPLSVYYTYVEDGAQAVEYLDESGNNQVASSFYILVLRHDVLDVEIRQAGNPRDPVLQTGPLYWTRGAISSKPKSWRDLVAQPITFIGDILDDAQEEESATEAWDRSMSRKPFFQQVEEIQRVLITNPITDVDESSGS